MREKPRTFIGQRLELKAAWCVLFAELCKAFGLRKAETHYRRRALELRYEWWELEHPGEAPR